MDGRRSGDFPSDRRIWFVNRFFWPDHSATSQIVSDLAFHLAKAGRRVEVIASRGLYDDPEVTLPQHERRNGELIYRVADPNFGRRSLAGRSVDYLSLYRGFAAALWRMADFGLRGRGEDHPRSCHL